MKKIEKTRGRKDRFSDIWSTSRKEAGKTQEFMAEGLGISIKTVRNWENGVTAPDLFTGSEWFRLLGVNPLPYYLSYLFPELFGKYEPDETDEEIDETLMFLIKNMAAKEKRELLYLMAGEHGSPWYSLLQMFTAHCHTSLESRVLAAHTILDSYEMEDAAGVLVCPEGVRPDLELLRTAIEQGKISVMHRLHGYTNVVPKNETKEEIDE